MNNWILPILILIAVGMFWWYSSSCKPYSGPQAANDAERARNYPLIPYVEGAQVIGHLSCSDKDPASVEACLKTVRSIFDQNARLNTFTVVTDTPDTIPVVLRPYIKFASPKDGIQYPTTATVIFLEAGVIYPPTYVSQAAIKK